MFYFILLFIFGAVIGSFLNVCIHRIPIKKSIVLPNSYCPNCNTPIKWYDNMPIISFILLKRKCRFCKEKISFRYFFVELITPIMLILLYINMDRTFSLNFYIYAVLFLSLIVLLFIDLQHQILPNRITYPLLAAGLIISLIKPGFSPKEALFGALVGGGSLYLIVILSGGGMGLGDVKLAAAIGSFLGWKNTVDSLFAGFLIGGLVSVFLLIMGRVKRKQPIPFGPFISIGVFLVFLLKFSFIDNFFTMR